MTRDQIISELFTSKDFNSCIKKMKPENLQDELRAEVALILCEKPDSVIVDLWKLGKLKFYTVRVILNLMQSSSSPFYKKFRNINTTIFDFVNIELFDKEPKDWQIDHRLTSLLIDKDQYDHRPDLAIAEIDNLYWYDREILKLYAQYGTYRKVEEVTGIPFESVYKTTQRACAIIRKKVA